MTRNEMDEFLQSIGGLENGFYPDKPNIVSSDFFAISEGWYPLVRDLIQEIIQLGWDKQICQVKEKFGGLRFYINTASDEVFTKIWEAENRSLTICEITGRPGKLRTDIGWWRTLCEEEWQRIKSNM